MLKIGTLKWKGRCGKHPRFDPEQGEGAIRGGCIRCYALLDIYRQHKRLIEMMRAFGPMRERTRLKQSPIHDRQTSLFD
jgi:hypothetical protein